MARVKWGLLAKIILASVVTFAFFKSYLTVTSFISHHLTPKYAAARTVDLPPNEISSDLNFEDPPHWFVQVSDIHLSNFYDLGRRDDFVKLCHYLAQFVKPSTVLMTGDITSAKDDANRHMTRQFSDEWRSYHDIVIGSGILNSSKWLDLRGNHDTFDVPSDQSKVNFFKNFSIQRSGKRSYLYTVQNVDFIGIDFTPSPGFKQPYNFMGYLDDEEVIKVKQLIKDSNSEFKIFFGHYPTSFVGSSVDIRDLMSEGTAYLCGHLHTLFHMVNRMYTRHTLSLIHI